MHLIETRRESLWSVLPVLYDLFSLLPPLAKLVASAVISQEQFWLLQVFCVLSRIQRGSVHLMLLGSLKTWRLEVHAQCFLSHVFASDSDRALSLFGSLCCL